MLKETCKNDGSSRGRTVRRVCPLLLLIAGELLNVGKPVRYSSHVCARGEIVGHHVGGRGLCRCGTFMVERREGGKDMTKREMRDRVDNRTGMQQGTAMIGICANAPPPPCRL